MFRRASVGLTEWAVLELGDHDRAIPILGPEARRDRTLGGRIAISNRYFEVFGLMPERAGDDIPSSHSTHSILRGDAWPGAPRGATAHARHRDPGVRL